MVSTPQGFRSCMPMIAGPAKKCTSVSTNSDEKSERLMAKYESQVLPSVLIYDGRGQQVRKLAEWVPPDKLLPILKQTK